VTRERVQVWKGVGVNRLSLGVQSFDDGVLKFLGRCHDAGKAREACEILASEMENWGLDLIFGASDMKLWEESLALALGFSPTHVSAYGLTYEENTPFWQQREDAIDDDIALEQYRLAHEVLGDYEHYEVSNFAQAGRESAHNQLYWRNEGYLGFGPGAVSYMGDTRISNARSISGYEREPMSGRMYDELTQHEVKVETLIQHFRTRAGIGEGYYEERFGESITVDFEAALRELVERGLLTCENGVYAPTLTGYELNNEIGLRLVGDD
jgi:oxygen-independent coproporphyrinogen-3 oxidase